MSSGEIRPNGISNLRSGLAISVALVLGGGAAYGMANAVAKAVDSAQQGNISKCNFALQQVKPGPSEQIPRECANFDTAMLGESTTVYSDVYTGASNVEEKQSSTLKTYVVPPAEDFVRQEAASWQKTKNNWNHLDEGFAALGCLVGLAALVVVNPDLTKFKKRSTEV